MIELKVKAMITGFLLREVRVLNMHSYDLSKITISYSAPNVFLSYRNSIKHTNERVRFSFSCVHRSITTFSSNPLNECLRVITDSRCE